MYVCPFLDKIFQFGHMLNKEEGYLTLVQSMQHHLLYPHFALSIISSVRQEICIVCYRLREAYLGWRPVIGLSL